MIVHQGVSVRRCTCMYGSCGDGNSISDTFDEDEHCAWVPG